MGQIEITGIEIFAYHGVYPAEKSNGQIFLVDAKVEFDFEPVAKHDDVSATINYVDLVEFIVQVVQGNRFDLLETLAVKINQEILNKYQQVITSKVQITKPEIVFPVKVKSFSVGHELTR